jgi:outer membrane lipoprotein-sorting protein
MTSGSKIRIERWCRWLVAALCLTASSAWAFDLPELMGLLARQKNGGTLSFQAPDRLTRRTLTPRPETMTVDGNTLTLSRGGRTRTLTLDSMPELLGMVEAMRSTLNGNAQTLQRYFRSTLTGSPDKWTLDLMPIDEKLAAQVRSLRLTGKAGEVLGIEMEFIGGDRSVMVITPVRGAS